MFEFAVILLGVLAAQSLSNAFADRAEKRQAQAAHAALERDLFSLGVSSVIRERLHACQVYRLRTISNAIAAGRAPSIDVLPPTEALVVDVGWDGEVPTLIAEHFGPEEADRYANIALWADALARAQADEQQSWAPIGRIAGRFGTPGAADLSAAKEGVVAAVNDLRRVQYATLNIARHIADADIDLSEELDGFGARRSSSDPCEAALGYSVEEHREAAALGRLVTGEEIPARAEPVNR